VSAGTLYLAPVLLGDADPAASIPSGAQARLHGLRLFIAESPKSARAFLKAIAHPGPIAALTIEALTADATAADLARLLLPVRNGADAAVLSDAGAPGVADPGAALVRHAHGAGVPVVPLVGPSSILLALMACGLEGQRFAFHGYLPVPEAALKQKLKALEADSRRERRTEIFIETPYRNDRLLRAIVETCADDTLLCLATDLSLAGERIATRTVAAWRALRASVGKRPSVFLLLASRNDARGHSPSHSPIPGKPRGGFRTTGGARSR
jgi:16S rRNA (cytidine1402-2'-O)-methyltransferase